MNGDTNTERTKPDQEFQEKCLQERTVKIPPMVTIIEQEEKRQSLATQHKNNSDYFLEGAQNLLKSSTPSLSILVGFFALEHKANQLLALKHEKFHHSLNGGLLRKPRIDRWNFGVLKTPERFGTQNPLWRILAVLKGLGVSEANMLPVYLTGDPPAL